MSYTFEAYQEGLLAFERERGWDRVLPSHTFLHMAEELGEIGRVLQCLDGYRTSDQSPEALRDALAGELADLTAFVFIVSEHSDHYQQFVEKAKSHRSIQECHSIMGSGSHILKVRAKNSQALEDLLYEIQNWPGVSRTQSNLVLSSYKETSSIDLKEIQPKH